MVLEEPERLQRSASLIFDLSEPSRLTHFRPTSKSTALIDAICGRRTERATMVIAAYGTGKSITSAVAGHAVMAKPESRDLLRVVGARLTDVDSELADYIGRQARLRRSRGIVVALEGYQQDLLENLKKAIRISVANAKIDFSIKKWVIQNFVQAEVIGWFLVCFLFLRRHLSR